MFSGSDEDSQYQCSEKASSHFGINVSYSFMLIWMGLQCRAHAVIMDSPPTKDTNGPVLRDGKLKHLNACCFHSNETKKECSYGIAIIQQILQSKTTFQIH